MIISSSLGLLYGNSWRINNKINFHLNAWFKTFRFFPSKIHKTLCFLCVCDFSLFCFMKNIWTHIHVFIVLISSWIRLDSEGIQPMLPNFLLFECVSDTDQIWRLIQMFYRRSLCFWNLVLTEFNNTVKISYFWSILVFIDKIKQEFETWL